MLFTARSENEGRFSFGSIPKGDYLLRAKGPLGYPEVQREIRVTKNNKRRDVRQKIGDITRSRFVRMSGTRIKRC